MFQILHPPSPSPSTKIYVLQTCQDNNKNFSMHVAGLRAQTTDLPPDPSSPPLSQLCTKPSETLHCAPNLTLCTRNLTLCHRLVKHYTVAPFGNMVLTNCTRTGVGTACVNWGVCKKNVHLLYNVQIYSSVCTTLHQNIKLHS